MVTRVPASRGSNVNSIVVSTPNHRALDGVAPRRLVRGDLEGQIELTIVAATLLPQSRAQPNGAAIDDLGMRDVIVPVRERALVG